MGHAAPGPTGRRSYDEPVSSAPAPGLTDHGRRVAIRERRLRWVSVVVLLGFLIVVVLITLTPGPPDPDGQRQMIAWLARAHRAGLPLWITYDLIEFSSNVVMFLPLGLFGALALPSRRRWLAVPALVLLTVGIELTQGAGLPGRFASVSDVLANSLGGLLGYLLAVLVVRMLRRHGRGRHRAVAPRIVPAEPPPTV